MTDSADRFEDWINDMDEDEFIDRINSSPEDGGFTDRQERIALTIREPVDEEQMQELERAQEGVIEVEQPRRGEERVYDTRDIKVATNQEGDAVIAVDSRETPAQIQQRLSEPIQSEAVKKRSILDRLRSFFRRK